MGVEARFQAIPEDCELLNRARQDRELAELLEAFNTFATGEGWEPKTDNEIYFNNAVQELIHSSPGLIERYLHNVSRGWDRIIYLLSPVRRSEDWGNKVDDTLIHKAIMGVERLYPEAVASQGFPIGFVPAIDVRQIADFLDSITLEEFREHHNPQKMREMDVYKMFPDSGEEVFQSTWAEFQDIRNVYQEAAAHNEAMITAID